MHAPTRHHRLAAVLLVPLALTIGCGAAVDGRVPAAATSAPAAPLDLPVPSTEPTASPVPVVAVDDRLEARLDLAGGPDWLAADGDGVWVKLDMGAVTRVDAATGQPTRSVDLSPHLCQGIGVAFGSVWACDDQVVARVNPISGEIEARFTDLRKHADQGHLVASAGRMWVVTGTATTLVGIDPATNHVVSTIDLGARATELGAGPAGLWVVSSLDDQILRIDPEEGRVALRITDVDAPRNVAVTDRVWVAAYERTVRLDPGTGAVLASTAIGSGQAGGIAVGLDAVWVRSAERFLVRLDPDDATPIEEYRSDVSSGGDVLVAHGSVWVTAYDDAALLRLRRD